MPKCHANASVAFNASLQLAIDPSESLQLAMFPHGPVQLALKMCALHAVCYQSLFPHMQVGSLAYAF